MFTTDEIRSVPIFSGLAQPELELLARTSGDLRLAAGEFAAHEGGEERALYAVVSGRMEVIKLIDGVERRLGWRPTGAIFGELPVALNTPLFGGYRAAEPSRVLRIELRQYFAIAAASPEVAMRVAELARERVGGMQGIASEAPTPRVTMVGQRWDEACSNLRQFLSRNQILEASEKRRDPALGRAAQHLSRITGELQESVMRARMEPVGRAWARVPRLVRDLAALFGKQVRVTMKGGETELDRTILEAIADPLTHIVRNSLDHGIERPDTRKATGKPATGRLTLSAYQEGGHVVIEIKDDGAGIDAERVRKAGFASVELDPWLLEQPEARLREAGAYPMRIYLARR